ncbi:MAG TPA: class I mannose-6-phosphate isomerase, partial [Anaerolineae bacterium]
RLIACDYFALDVLASQTNPIALDTRGESFHAITILEGKAQIASGDWNVTLNRFETALVPADCGAYQLQPLTAFRALKSSVK